MRVVEPKQFAGNSKKTKKRGRLKVLSVFVLLILIAGAAGFGYMQWNDSKSKPVATNNATVAPPDQSVVLPKKDIASLKLKEFKPDEFKTLYQNMNYPNTQALTDSFTITENVKADVVIRAAAEARGYRMTKIPVSSVVKVDEPMLGDNNLLQPLAAQGWAELKAAAKKDGIPLTIISAYRSPEAQRELFLPRLLGNGTTVADLANGGGTAALETTLHMTAVPGFSRHHTGYTVDLWCEDGTGGFAASSCFTWIFANNYKHAKENGWIPSYPEGADQQGPEPEPWEYVWVGKESLYQ